MRELIKKIVSLRNIILTLGLVFISCAPPSASSSPPVDAKSFVINTVVFFLMIFFVWFLLVLRPSFLKEDQQKKFLESLKKNDEVVTSGGIFGRIVEVKPGFITLEIAANVRIKVKPEHVTPVVNVNKPTTKVDSGAKAK